MAFERRARRLRAIAWVVLAATGPFATGAVAWADPTAAEKETARSLMDRGHQSRDRGEHAAALESFRAADAMMHVPTTGLEVAREQVALKQLVEARDTLLQVLRLPARAQEPMVFTQARAAAQALNDDLVGRIPSIRLTVTGAAPGEAPEVKIDGVALASPALTAPFKANPGHHVFEATTPTAQGKAETDVAERETKAVDLALAPRADLASADDVKAPDAATDDEEEPANTAATIKRVLFWAGGGLAAAGLITGSVTGALSMSSASSAKSVCDASNRCPPPTWGDIDSAHTTATISTIAFIAAGAGAVAFAASFFIPTKAASEAPPPASAHRLRGPEVTPWLGLGAAGVRGSF